MMVTMWDPVKSQNVSQDYDVDCDHVLYERSVMIITMRDPVNSQSVSQGGDKDYDVDSENIFHKRNVMIITMWDPVKSQNVAVLGGGPVLLHRVAPLLDQRWHL